MSDKLFTKLSKQTIERLNVAVRTKNLGVISQRVRGEGSTGVPRPDDLAVIIYLSLIHILILTEETDRYDAPFEGSRCGTCRSCIDNCPTGAVAPDKMCIRDSRCSSFRARASTTT